MSAWSLLLRVLLTVALILNGSGPAVASAHLQMQHTSMAGMASQRTASPPAAAAPCPQHPQRTASMARHSVADAASDPATTKTGRQPADCCKTGACRCACVQQAPAAVAAVALPQAVLERASSLRPMPSGHDAPTLPHLIRPPIS